MGRANRRGRRVVTVERIGFAFNPTNPAALELRDRAEAWCRMRQLAAWAAPSGEVDELLRELPTTDVLVVLGGDGTFLRAARAVAEVDTPILGVNLGKVGFLSKVEAHELEAVLAQVTNGEYRLDERMTIGATILPGGRSERGEEFTALNDVVVARGELARVCRLRDVHRGRPRRRVPDRVDRLLVLGRRPDRRPAQPEPHRHADRRVPRRDPLDRRQPAPGRPLPGRRRA
ncbi:MAG: NAD(+)/NADH kinase [Chloroflexi bacterium]|nr:MAG: NAD(+)/NADH kinase [Chloroflexota bacterium]